MTRTPARVRRERRRCADLDNKPSPWCVPAISCTTAAFSRRLKAAASARSRCGRASSDPRGNRVVWHDVFLCVRAAKVMAVELRNCASQLEPATDSQEAE